MCKGLPASGKTTWAKEQVKASKGTCVRINKDDLRAMVDAGLWSRENEERILHTRNKLIITYLEDPRVRTIIVDDTNLAPKHEKSLKQLADKFDAFFRVEDFTHVPLNECIQRDAMRSFPVGKKVILDMWRQYGRKYLYTAPAYIEGLPDAVIIDIDGTIATHEGVRGPFEWDKVELDLPRKTVLNTAASLANDNDAYMLFTSGRDEVCRDSTYNWLNKLVDMDNKCKLFMRKQKDMRKDSIVKEELYNEYIKDKYNVIAIFDDRASVCRLWTRLGFADRLFRVGVVDEDDF
jgi:predicted kinase